MRHREFLFGLFALVLSTAAASGIAAAGDEGYIGLAAQAQTSGFDALAHRVFGGNACTLENTHQPVPEGY